MGCPDSASTGPRQHEGSLSLLLAEHAQQALQTKADHQINYRKENCCQSSHDKDHDCGQHDFATGGPNDLAYLGTDLLDELNGIDGGHVPCISLLAGSAAFNANSPRFQALGCFLRHPHLRQRLI